MVSVRAADTGTAGGVNAHAARQVPGAASH